MTNLKRERRRREWFAFQSLQLAMFERLGKDDQNGRAWVETRPIKKHGEDHAIIGHYPNGVIVLIVPS